MEKFVKVKKPGIVNSRSASAKLVGKEYRWTVSIPATNSDQREPLRTLGSKRVAIPELTKN